MEASLELEPVRFRVGVNSPAEAFIANVKANIDKRLPRLCVKQCALVGGGPSMADHLREIRALQAAGGDIFALNGAVRFLLDHGIGPDYGIIYDSRKDNAGFIQGGVHWLIASHAHPDVFEEARRKMCRVTMFHSSGEKGVAELIRDLEANATIFEGTSTAGLQALSIASIMGYKVARLYGYDSSARDGDKHAYAQPLNDGQRLLDIHFNGKIYPASATMAEQAKLFAETYALYENIGLNITVIGEGLLPDMWRYHEANKGPITGDTLEELEAAKYQYIWEKDTYRRVSPGELILDSFLDVMQPFPGARIIDFGCGPGRATAKLAELGFSVLGVDHAANCLDVGVTVPLCIATLWRLPETVKGDYGLCADVMEHIPPQHVEDVLSRIAGALDRGCYFNISFKPDNHGDRKTGPLHLTVKPAEWWSLKLSNHFGTVSHKGGGLFACLK